MDIYSASELKKEAEKAAAWINLQGYANKPSRFTQYQEDFETLVSNLKSGIEPEATYNSVMANAHHEISHVSSIATAFEETLPEVARIKLGEALFGPKFYTDENPETSSNRSRNTLFEFLVAATLKDCGCNIKWNANYDVIADYDDQTYIVECKRPSTIKAIESRLSKSLKQLRSAYKSGPKGCLGIIAFSFDKLINPDQSFKSVPNMSYASTAIQQEIEPFQEHIRRKLANRGTTRTIGVITITRRPVYSREDNVLFSMSQVSFFFRGKTTSPHREKFRKLASAIAADSKTDNLR